MRGGKNEGRPRLEWARPFCGSFLGDSSDQELAVFPAKLLSRFLEFHLLQFYIRGQGRLQWVPKKLGKVGLLHHELS